jgi:hypothetical protein
MAGHTLRPGLCYCDGQQSQGSVQRPYLRTIWKSSRGTPWPASFRNRKAHQGRDDDGLELEGDACLRLGHDASQLLNLADLRLLFCGLSAERKIRIVIANSQERRRQGFRSLSRLP